jgi:hypothetical protein
MTESGQIDILRNEARPYRLFTPKLKRHQNHAEFVVLALACFLLVACAAPPPPYEGGPLETYDESTTYSLVDHSDGYEIHLFYEKEFNTGFFGGPHHTEVAEECGERIYWIAQQYAEKHNQRESYLEWERAKRVSDAMSASLRNEGNQELKSLGSGIRYDVSGGPMYKCHAYAYFRWKAHPLQ